MKLATFSAGGAPELGLVSEDRIRSLSRAAPQLAVDMLDLITRWPRIAEEVRRLAREDTLPSMPLSGVELLAPIRRPGKIMAIGLNYADHIAESRMETPKDQVWFSKASTSANGPYDPI